MVAGLLRPSDVVFTDEGVVERFFPLDPDGSPGVGYTDGAEDKGRRRTSRH